MLWKAVNGMLPKNKLRRVRLALFAAADYCTHTFPDALSPQQARMCKLLLYPGEEHDLPRGSQLVPWQPPPRSLRRSEGVFELPPGFAPLSTQAYTKRFGHLLPGPQQAQLQRLPQTVSIPERASSAG